MYYFAGVCVLVGHKIKLCKYILFLFFLTECEKDTLQEKVRSLQEACCKLQERIHQMDSQISETKLCLDKEKAKYHSACRQQEVSVVGRVNYWMLKRDFLVFFLTGDV